MLFVFLALCLWGLRQHINNKCMYIGMEAVLRYVEYSMYVESSTACRNVGSSVENFESF